MIRILLLTMCAQMMVVYSSARGRPAELTKSQLIEGLARRREQLMRMHVLYRFEVEGEPNSRVIHMARDGEKRFQEYEIEEGQMAGEHMMAAYNGTRSKALDFNARAGNVSLGKQRSAETMDLLCTALHVPLRPSQFARENDPENDYFLPAGIKENRYIVKQQQEEVEGYWTHVINARDQKRPYGTFWIDPEQDFILVRWELHDKGGTLITRQRFQDFRSAGGRMFPRTIVTEDYDPRRPGAGPKETTRIRILEAAVGDVDPQVFDPIFPPGTVVYEGIGGTTYEVPGEWEREVENLSQRARDNLRKFQRRMEYGAWYSRPTVWLFIVIGSACLVAIAMLSRKLMH